MKKFLSSVEPWLAPIQFVYRYYFRDRPFATSPARSQQEGVTGWHTCCRSALVYLVRSYQHLFTIRTPAASRRRHLQSTAADSVPFRILKPLQAAPRDSALFVTYHPLGFISDHVRHYLEQFKRAGKAVILIKTVDQMDHPLADSYPPDIDAAMVRKNAGFDFGAWAHGLRLFPEVYHGETLWFANDSVFGPANSEQFHRLLEDVETSGADLVGLTENYLYCHHYQSYFLVFRNLPLRAAAVRQYWDNVRNLSDKTDVILEYELGLQLFFSSLGFRCISLFSSTSVFPTRNPTTYGWKNLLDENFPFLKVSLLRDADTESAKRSFYEAFARTGYDCRLMQQHLDGMQRQD